MLKWPFPSSVKTQILTRVSLIISCLQILFVGLLVSIGSLGFISYNAPEAEEKEWFCGTVSPSREVLFINPGLLGPEIFSNYCSPCHTIGEEIVVGPGLKNILARRDTIWVKNFILDSQAMISSGDTLAQDLFYQFNEHICPPLNSINPEKDVEDLIEFFMYVDSLDIYY